VTKNRRAKTKIRQHQAATGTRYTEARRHVATPAPDAADQVVVLPPRADWRRPKDCSLWEQLQREHGPLIGLRIAEGPRWWELDDLARTAAGALQDRPSEQRGLWLGVWPGYSVTRRQYLPGIAANLARAQALDRLEVREIPTAADCSHASCRRRRGLPALPRTAQGPAPECVVESLPFREPVVAFAGVLEQHPTLNRHGFGFDQGRSPDERRREIERHRQDLIAREELVRRVHDWLVINVAAIKTPNTGSYGLKHIAEDILGEYVANGELITAALMAGYPMRHDDGPNALFAMSKRDVNRLRTQQKDASRTAVG
jgi:hypothetical protein